MIAKVYSAIPEGYSGSTVEVEADSSKSLPGFNIVGMASKTVSEARERVRRAITNSGFVFPPKKVTVNLAPAELTKDGSHLDLPIALAILVLSGQLSASHLSGKAFAGELSLDGGTRPVRGIINIVETIREQGFEEIYVPSNNYAQASLVKGIKIIGVSTLMELVLHLCGVEAISPPSISPLSAPLPRQNVVEKIYIGQSVVKNTETDGVVLDQIAGQELAKRALIIALAGHHHLLLSGPPGAGKTMLAKVAANLLPGLTPEEQLEITKIHNLSTSVGEIQEWRPFRAPHHTASHAALIGGGPNATPGEISLAHHGILFLDEFPEFSRRTIESLRQPLENQHINIDRATHHAVFPANFLLIATMNPCPCGYLNSPDRACVCSAKQIEDYRNKISGPILDRIDLTIEVKRSDRITAFSEQLKTDQEHKAARTMIQRAFELQQRRYNQAAMSNGSLSGAEIKQFLHLTPEAENLLSQATDKLKLSFRSHLKVIRVAQTIADLDNSAKIQLKHLSEALTLRQKI